MSATREILTLQFGNYANYIGSHWWNIQVSNVENSCANSVLNLQKIYRNQDFLMRNPRSLLKFVTTYYIVKV